jgi:hypothetical protein
MNGRARNLLNGRQWNQMLAPAPETTPKVGQAHFLSFFRAKARQMDRRASAQ